MVSISCKVNMFVATHGTILSSCVDIRCKKQDKLDMDRFVLVSAQCKDTAASLRKSLYIPQLHSNIATKHVRTHAHTHTHTHTHTHHCSVPPHKPTKDPQWLPAPQHMYDFPLHTQTPNMQIHHRLTKDRSTNHPYTVPIGATPM